MLSSRTVTDDSAYRRGTLFGFTLAEIVLLVIFALLLAMASLVAIKQQRIADLERATNGMVQIPATEAKLVEAVINAYQVDGQSPPPPDDLFRDLRLAQDARRRAAGAARDGEVRRAMEQLRRSLTDAQVDPPAELTNLATTIDGLAGQARKSNQDPAKVVSEALRNLSALLAEKGTLEKNIAELSAQLEQVKQELNSKGNNELPPILVIPTNNYFQLGKATLEPEFRARLLDEYAPKLVAAVQKHGLQVIEIVGHTDEVAIENATSNLDKRLLPFLNSRWNETVLTAADNAGLGLARAAAVWRVLRDIKDLENVRILPMSAGQVIDTDQSVSSGTKPADDASRRRIEIRMRRLK